MGPSDWRHFYEEAMESGASPFTGVNGGKVTAPERRTRPRAGTAQAGTGGDVSRDLWNCHSSIGKGRGGANGGVPLSIAPTREWQHVFNTCVVDVMHAVQFRVLGTPEDVLGLQRMASAATLLSSDPLCLTPLFPDETQTRARARAATASSAAMMSSVSNKVGRGESMGEVSEMPTSERKMTDEQSTEGQTMEHFLPSAYRMSSMPSQAASPSSGGCTTTPLGTIPCSDPSFPPVPSFPMVPGDPFATSGEITKRGGTSLASVDSHSSSFKASPLHSPDDPAYAWWRSDIPPLAASTVAIDRPDTALDQDLTTDSRHDTRLSGGAMNATASASEKLPRPMSFVMHVEEQKACEAEDSPLSDDHSNTQQPTSTSILQSSLAPQIDVSIEGDEGDTSDDSHPPVFGSDSKDRDRGGSEETSATMATLRCNESCSLDTGSYDEVA